MIARLPEILKRMYLRTTKKILIKIEKRAVKIFLLFISLIIFIRRDGAIIAFHYLLIN